MDLIALVVVMMAIMLAPALLLFAAVVGGRRLADRLWWGPIVCPNCRAANQAPAPPEACGSCGRPGLRYAGQQDGFRRYVCSHCRSVARIGIESCKSCGFDLRPIAMARDLRHP